MKQYDRRRGMRTLWLCIAVLALCAAGALALLLWKTPAARDEVIPGPRGDIYATVQMPNKLSRGDTVPLVVLCHGFTGNRDGDGHFGPLAEDLAEEGIASVRLDFAGCGDSTEPYTAYTLDNMAADVNAVIGYMKQEYNIRGATALVGHSMGGRLASLYPQQKGGIAALVLWSPANGAGLNGLEFLNIDDFSAVEAMAAEAEANGSVTAWGVELSAAYMDEMRTSDPNAALRESALPTLLTYSGSEGILSSTTQAETIAAVQSLPDGQVVLDPFVAGNHNYLSDDPATAAALDKALRQTTIRFLTQYLG